MAAASLCNHRSSHPLTLPLFLLYFPLVMRLFYAYLSMNVLIKTRIKQNTEMLLNIIVV